MSDIKDLAAALAQAQAVMAGAKKDSLNPGFKSRYADLASVWDACRKPLTDHGLSVVQYTRYVDGLTLLVTRLMHVSGQYLEGEYPVVPMKPDPQGMGSALTYARRYGLSAMVGIAPEDDDGNAASVTPSKAAAPAHTPAGYEQWRDDISAAAENGLEALRGAWQSSKVEYRTLAGAAFLDGLKAKAATVAA